MVITKSTSYTEAQKEAAWVVLCGYIQTATEASVSNYQGSQVIFKVTNPAGEWFAVIGARGRVISCGKAVK